MPRAPERARNHPRIPLRPRRDASECPVNPCRLWLHRRQGGSGYSGEHLPISLRPRRDASDCSREPRPRPRASGRSHEHLHISLRARWDAMDGSRQLRVGRSAASRSNDHSDLPPCPRWDPSQHRRGNCLHVSRRPRDGASRYSNEYSRISLLRRWHATNRSRNALQFRQPRRQGAAGRSNGHSRISLCPRRNAPDRPRNTLRLCLLPATGPVGALARAFQPIATGSTERVAAFARRYPLRIAALSRGHVGGFEQPFRFIDTCSTSRGRELERPSRCHPSAMASLGW